MVEPRESQLLMGQMKCKIIQQLPRFTKPNGISTETEKHSYATVFSSGKLSTRLCHNQNLTGGDKTQATQRCFSLSHLGFSQEQPPLTLIPGHDSLVTHAFLEAFQMGFSLEHPGSTLL